MGDLRSIVVVCSCLEVLRGRMKQLCLMEVISAVLLRYRREVVEEVVVCHGNSERS